MLFPFLGPDETALRLSGAPLTFTTCKNVISVPQAIHDLVAPDKIASGTLCEARPFHIYNGKTLNLVYALNRDTLGAVTTSTSRSLSVAVDDTGRVIQTFAPQSILIPLLLIIASAVLFARDRQTTGKRLARIRIVGEGCAMCREVRRLGLFVVVGIFTLALGMAPPTALAAHQQGPVVLLLMGGAVVFVLAVALYIWPLLRWRGAIPYDRATGFTVTRA